MTGPRSFSLVAAGFPFELCVDEPLDSLWPWGDLCGDQPPAQPLVRIQLHPHDALHPRAASDRPVFDSEGTWAMYAQGERVLVVLPSPATGAPAERTALLDADLRRVEVRGCGPPRASDRERGLPGALAFPLWELLMVALLGQGRGLMVHASAVVDGDQGYLFPGGSTHGKSTMARLWKGEGVVVHDDRVVLREEGGELRMYPPYPRHADPHEPHGAPLTKVFLLRHHPRHEALRLRGAGAAARLVARSFLPVWDATAMAFTLDFCARLAERVPCFDLGFAPQPDVRELVRCAS